MKAELGIVGLSLALWAAGAGVLLGAGVMSRAWRSVLLWSGAAFLVGTATVGALLTVLSFAGVRVSTPLTALVVLGVVAAGVAVAVLRRPAPLPARDGVPRDRGFIWAAGAIGALFAVIGTWVALVKPISEWDGWAIWGVKALLLYDSGRVPDELATGGYGLSHVDYPLLWPVLDATFYRAMGGPEAKLATMPQWLLYVAFAWTVVAVGARLTRPAIWAPLAAALLTAYPIVDQLFWHYADVPTGIMVGGAALFGGLWLAGHGARWLVPAAPLLAAAANGKNEGLAAAGAVLAGLAVGLVVRRRERWPAALAGLGAVVAVTVLSVLPWRLWIASHDVEGDIPASRALDVDELSDRSDRVEPSATALWDHITDTGRYGYLAFAAILLIGVAVWRRPTRSVGAFYGVTAVLVFVSLLLAYWVADTDLHWHLQTSADRVVQLLAFVAIAGVLQLAAVLYEEDPG